MKLVKLLSAAVAGVAMMASAHAADYPSKNLTVVVPFPPGGASDLTARLVTNEMQKTFGQPIVVENKAGANGSIGAAQVAQSPADGHSILVGSIGVYAINAALYPSLPYDPAKSFDLLTVAVRTPNVLVASPSFKANSVKELIDLMKAEPDKVTFASSGTGSSDHLTAALFMQKAGVKGVHVPYKGGGPAQTDLMGGHVDVSFQNLGAVSKHIKAGKMKLLAITADKRDAGFADTPTMKESGVTGVEVYSWQAIAAPKGLPADVKNKLHTALVAAINAPEVKGKFTDMGFEVVANTPEQFTAFNDQEIARWKAVVAEGKITPDK